MPLKLKIQENNDQTNLEERCFDGETVKIGRHESNDLQLKKNYISSFHAKLIQKKCDYYLQDLGSSNGTFLNNVRLKANEPTILQDKDRIFICDFTLIFNVVEEVPAKKKNETSPDVASITSSSKYLYESNLIILKLKLAFAQNIEKNKKERKIVLEEILSEFLSNRKKDEAKEILLSAINYFQNEEIKQETDNCDENERNEASHSGLLDIASSIFAKDKTLENKEQVDLFTERLKEILNLLVSQLSDNIKGYKKFQEQFDVESTRLLRLEVNPIKKALSPAQIGKYLLDWEENSFGLVHKSLNEVNRDLLLHPLAILKGFQNCFNELLIEISPSVLAKEAGENSENFTYEKARKILNPIMQKKMWNKFVEKHQELSENETKTFNLILSKFKKAYFSYIKGKRV